MTAGTAARLYPWLNLTVWCLVVALGGLVFRAALLGFVYAERFWVGPWCVWFLMDYGTAYGLMFPIALLGVADGTRWRVLVGRWGPALSMCGWAGVWLGNSIFHHQFRLPINERLLGLIYDDTGALVATAQRQYGWGWLGLAWAGGALAGCFLAWCWISSLNRRLPRAAVVAVVAAGALAAVAGIRFAGSEWGRVGGVSEQAFVTAANRVAANPLVRVSDVLWRVYVDRDQPAYVADVPRRIRTLYPEGKSIERVEDLLRGESAGRVIRPSQVFLIIMESYDMTLVDGLGAGASCCAEMRWFLRHGASSDLFTSEGNATIYSVGPLISGVPQVGVNPQPYEARAAQAFATSLPEAFKRWGYHTRFYYGGPASWQKIGAFAKAQGFDAVTCAEQIPHPKSAQHTWGIDDRYLFGFAQEEAVKATVPTLHVLLTTTNHAPFFLAETESAPSGNVMLEVAQRRRFRGPGVMAMIRHLAYSDACLGEFVRSVEREIPEALFVITGDHPSPLAKLAAHEGWMNQRVPLVIYGPKHVEGGGRLAPGTHLDIVPTLAELCAPAGVPYFSFGVSLFASTPSRWPAREGNGLVALPGGMQLVAPEVLSPDAWSQITEVQSQLEARRALAWWYMSRSDWLPR